MSEKPPSDAPAPGPASEPTPPEAPGSAGRPGGPDDPGVGENPARPEEPGSHERPESPKDPGSQPRRPISVRESVGIRPNPPPRPREVVPSEDMAAGRGTGAGYGEGSSPGGRPGQGAGAAGETGSIGSPAAPSWNFRDGDTDWTVTAVGMSSGGTRPDSPTRIQLLRFVDTGAPDAAARELPYAGPDPGNLFPEEWSELLARARPPSAPAPRERAGGVRRRPDRGR